MYTCARCGEESIENVEQDDDHQTSDEDGSFLSGWCNVCDDYRPVEE